MEGGHKEFLQNRAQQLKHRNQVSFIRDEGRELSQFRWDLYAVLSIFAKYFDLYSKRNRTLLNGLKQWVYGVYKIWN